MESQVVRLYKLLSDFKPHRVDEIVEKVYGFSGDGRTIARVGARKYDVEKKFGVEIQSHKDPHHKTLWVYQLKKVDTQKSFW